MQRRLFLLAASSAYFGSSALSPSAATPWPDGHLLGPLFLHGPVVLVGWVDPLPYLVMTQSRLAQTALAPAIRSAKARRAPAWAVRVLGDANVPASADRSPWRVELPALKSLVAAGVRQPAPGDMVSVAGQWRPPVTGASTIGAAVLLAAGRIHVFPR